MSAQTFFIMGKALKEGDIDVTTSDPDTVLLSHQKNVSVRILIALLFSGCFLWLGYTYWPFHPSYLPTQTDRLAYTAQWQVPSLILLVAAFGTSWKASHGGTKDNTVTAQKNFLTNTLEQFVANGMAQFILTTYLEANQMHLIPLFVTLFLIGRLQYWHGYLDSNRGRSNKAFGFGMTFYVTIGVVMYCTYRFVGDLLPL